MQMLSAQHGALQQKKRISFPSLIPFLAQHPSKHKPIYVGAARTAWGIWTRAWTAEENRHGDVMNKYMYLTGRMNMHAVEVTIQNLIGSGMDPKTENNPYLGFIYTSFQERATKVY